MVPGLHYKCSVHRSRWQSFSSMSWIYFLLCPHKINYFGTSTSLISGSDQPSSPLVFCFALFFVFLCLLTIYITLLEEIMWWWIWCLTKIIHYPQCYSSRLWFITVHFYSLIAESLSYLCYSHTKATSWRMGSYCPTLGRWSPLWWGKCTARVWPHCIYVQAAEINEGWCSAGVLVIQLKTPTHGVMLTALRLGLPTSTQPLNSFTSIQRLVFCTVLDLSNWRSVFTVTSQPFVYLTMCYF